MERAGRLLMIILPKETGFHGGGRKYGEEGVFTKNNLQREVTQNEEKRWYKSLNFKRMVGVVVPLK